MEKPSIASSRPPATTQLIASEKALVAYTSNIPGNASTDVGKPRKETIGGKEVRYMQWGAKNDVPNYREELVANNAIVPALMKRKRDLVLGQKWYAYRERFEDTPKGMNRFEDEIPMPEEAAAFFKDFSEKTAPAIVGELMKHELALVEIIIQRDGSMVEMNALETKYLRSGRKNARGLVEEWWWSNAWTNEMRKALESQGDQYAESIPVYAEGKKQGKYALVLGDWMFNDGYYPIPSWVGSQHWVELANIIPLFHAANLKNMSAPRWLLVIPHDYFVDYEALNAATTAEERQKVNQSAKDAQKQFVADFNELVTGVENTGRTLTIQSIQEEVMGKIIDKRIQVEPLVIDLRDKALLDLYDASNVANISAQGLHPTLANIQTEGKLSSGTEIRNAYLLWLVIAAPYYRRQIGRIVEHKKKVAGWPADVHFGIKDAELTTLADNPAGVRPAETHIAG